MALHRHGTPFRGAAFQAEIYASEGEGHGGDAKQSLGPVEPMVASNGYEPTNGVSNVWLMNSGLTRMLVMLVMAMSQGMISNGYKL